MIIRKLFKFENAHIVRNCSTQRCRSSIHGHSYKVEILLESDVLDNGQMLYDFGLLKFNIHDLIDSFDHTITLWKYDNSSYITEMKNHSERWIILPVSPSAEQFSRIFYLIIEKLLSLTIMINNEGVIKLNSVIVHETETGYAQCFFEDAYSDLMGRIDLNEIVFSKTVINEWKNELLWQNIISNRNFTNPALI